MNIKSGGGETKRKNFILPSNMNSAFISIFDEQILLVMMKYLLYSENCGNNRKMKHSWNLPQYTQASQDKMEICQHHNHQI
jgi:hypothetical protein